MKPKDLLLVRFTEHVVPALERHGFGFARSKLRFSRARGDFRQHIEICLDRYNVEDDCTFWSMWSVTSPVFARWYRAEFGVADAPDGVGGCADWNIPRWSGHERRHLVNGPGDADELKRFVADVEHAGLPYVEELSSWTGAAERLRRGRSSFDRAADLLVLAGERDRAREVLLEGIRAFELGGRHDALGELPRLKSRLARWFGA